jgi:hypothetical protein
MCEGVLNMAIDLTKITLAERLDELLKKRDWTRYRLAKEIHDQFGKVNKYSTSVKSTTRSIVNICEKNASPNIELLKAIA